MTAMAAMPLVRSLREPPPPPTLSTAELSECTCPEACECDHDRD